MTPNKDILLIETSLEQALVPEERRRTQLESFQAMLDSLGEGSRLYYERVHDLQGLKLVFEWCAAQNGQRRATKGSGGRVESARIGYIHISGHGDHEGLDIPQKAGEHDAATPQALANCFLKLQDAKIRAVIFSSCETAKNGELAKRVLEYSRAKAVVGYPERAFDGTCAIAEQLLYFQLLRREVKVWQSVRRVNDALYLLGEKEARMLYCWTREHGGFEGPCPWWTVGSEEEPERADRSYLASLVALTSKRGKWAEEKMKDARDLIKHIR